MQFAINKESKERVLPTPHSHAFCPLCQFPLVAKCGSVNIWHWAHTFNSNCPGAKLETAWHRRMKEKFPPNQCEIIVKNDLGVVIADVYIPETNTMHEFDFKNQLTSEEIIKKNCIYARSGYNVMWTFHIDDESNNRLTRTSTLEVYWFKHGLRRLLDFKTPFHLSFDDDIFEVTSYWQSDVDNHIYLKGHNLYALQDNTDIKSS